ncbi:MAG: hypothetical protein LBQ75_09540 [Zoogloeaceae bacterium]|nr:hypothetical protein [Zoogloeaceae bacterium]
MKKCLLLGMSVILLGGCPIHGPYYYDHDVTITLKDGVPCFGLADDAQLRSEQTEIYSIYVPRPENTIPRKSMMDKFMNRATLQSGECVPYEGEALENNVLYLIDFDVSPKNRRSNEVHGYSGLFCLSEKKNGEKALHHFKYRERPTSCPVSSGE